jgi:hypothetical protein
MTLCVSRDGQAVTIHGNVGLHVSIDDSRVTEFAVTEHAQHVEHFAGQLASLLKEAEAERTDNA